MTSSRLYFSLLFLLVLETRCRYTVGIYKQTISLCYVGVGVGVVSVYRERQVAPLESSFRRHIYSTV